MLRRLALSEGVTLLPLRIFSDARFLHLATQFVHSCPAFLHVQDVFWVLEQKQWWLQLQHGGTAVRSVGWQGYGCVHVGEGLRCDCQSHLLEDVVCQFECTVWASQTNPLNHNARQARARSSPRGRLPLHPRMRLQPTFCFFNGF